MEPSLHARTQKKAGAVMTKLIIAAAAMATAWIFLMELVSKKNHGDD